MMVEKGKTKGYKYSSTSKSPKNERNVIDRDFWMHLTQSHNTNIKVSDEKCAADNVLYKSVEATPQSENIIIHGKHPPIKIQEHERKRLRQKKIIRDKV